MLKLSIKELRRRKVFRGAALYLLGAWVVLQVADVVAEPAGLPSWTMTVLLYIAAIGFPFVLFLGWRYEIGDQGLVRTAPAQPDENTDLSLQKSDYIIIAAFAIVAALVAVQFIPQVIEEAEESVTIGGDTTVHQNSIAVLPFKDHSIESDHSYLADGVSDTVTHVLGQIEGLIVTARTSTHVFKERTANVLDIARELRVAHVLEGSVQRSGNKVRITAALIESAGGTELWSRQFNRDVTDIFEIQDEIAVEVVNALSDVLQQDTSEVKPEYRPDLAAYEQVVLGKQALDEHTVEGAMRAWEHFGNAIEIDPDYAMAYVHKADVLNMRQDLSHDERNELRWELVNKALELDPLSAEALTHQALAYRFDNESDRVEPILRRAIELNPSLVDARLALSQWLMIADGGDFEESYDQAQIAAELDPKNPRVMTQLATTNWNLSRSEAAIAIMKDLMRQDPTDPDPYYGLNRWYMQLGKPGEAMRYAQALLALDPESQQRQFAICMMHYQLWNEDEAFRCTVAYLDRFPGDLDAKKNLIWFRDGPEEAEPLFLQQIEQEPWSGYRKVQYANFLSWERRHGEVEEAVLAAFPDLAEDDPEISDWTTWPARLLALAWIKTGQQERGLTLLSNLEQAILRTRKLQGGGWVAGNEDSQIYAIRGEKDRALDALEAAIDDGWMFYAFGLENDPSFDAYKNDERFLAIVQKLAGRMAEERQYYEEHKDEPLF